MLFPFSSCTLSIFYLLADWLEIVGKLTELSWTHWLGVFSQMVRTLEEVVLFDDDDNSDDDYDNFDAEENVDTVRKGMGLILDIGYDN